jgi:hypothetical protein
MGVIDHFFSENYEIFKEEISKIHNNHADINRANATTTATTSATITKSSDLFGNKEAVCFENGFGRSTSLPTNQIIANGPMSISKSTSGNFSPASKDQTTTKDNSSFAESIDEPVVDPFYTDPFNTELSQNAFMDNGFDDFKTNNPKETNNTDWALFDDGVTNFLSFNNILFLLTVSIAQLLGLVQSVQFITLYYKANLFFVTTTRSNLYNKKGCFIPKM